MHGLSSFEPCDLRKNYFIFVTSYYGQWGTCGGNLLVGFKTCFLHDKLHSLYTDNPITDERKINCNGIAMTSGANKIDLITLVLCRSRSRFGRVMGSKIPQ